MRKFAGAICFIAITWLVLAPSVASAAYQAYVTVKGQKQGKYKGPNIQNRTVKPSSTGNRIVPNKQGPSQYPMKH